MQTASIELTTLAIILTLHFVADFIMQSDYIAKTKSTSWKSLSIHVGIYTLVLALLNPIWALVNGLLHFCVDAVTSRLTSMLWQAKKTHYFFVVIGLDQLLHALMLVTTYIYLTR